MSAGGEAVSARPDRGVSGSAGDAEERVRPVVCHVIVGPPTHGVTRYGLSLADACAGSPGGFTHRIVQVAGRDDLAPPPRLEADIIHVTFTDHLFGADPEAAARAVARLVESARRPGVAAGLLYETSDGGAPAGAAAQTLMRVDDERDRGGVAEGAGAGAAGSGDRAAGRAAAANKDRGATDRPRLSVSVHDVPQPTEGEERFARRARGYAALAAHADIVVVNSAHEAAFFDGSAAVVPLPIEAPRPQPPAPADRARGTAEGRSVSGSGPEAAGESGDAPSTGVSSDAPPTVGLLGFIYPGKGYERVIEAVPAGVRVRALGAVAAGHDDYAAQLSALAASRGVDFQVTGYVPEAGLAAELDAITVPVCPHRHVSASGSLNTWIAHNRRVVVADGPYMREVADRWPGRVVLAGDGPAAPDLASTIAAMLADPDRTWAAEPPPAWDWADLAAAYAGLWDALR